MTEDGLGEIFRICERHVKCIRRISQQTSSEGNGMKIQTYVRG